MLNDQNFIATLFKFSNFGHWNLFDIWNLTFVISISEWSSNKANPLWSRIFTLVVHFFNNPGFSSAFGDLVKFLPQPFGQNIHTARRAEPALAPSHSRTAAKFDPVQGSGAMIYGYLNLSFRHQFTPADNLPKQGIFFHQAELLRVT